MGGFEKAKADQAWLSRSDEAWRRAETIVRDRPDLDLHGVYHVLRNLERSPEERLRRALTFWQPPS